MLRIDEDPNDELKSGDLQFTSNLSGDESSHVSYNGLVSHIEICEETDDDRKFPLKDVSDSESETSRHFLLPQNESLVNRIVVSRVWSLNDENDQRSESPWNEKQRHSDVHLPSEESTPLEDSTADFKVESLELLETADKNRASSSCKQIGKKPHVELKFASYFSEDSNTNLSHGTLPSSTNLSPVVKVEESTTDWRVDTKDEVTNGSIQLLLENDDLFDLKYKAKNDSQVVIEHDQSGSSNQQAEFKCEPNIFANAITLTTYSPAELHEVTSEDEEADDGDNRSTKTALQVCPDKFLCKFCGVEIRRAGLLDHFRSDHCKEKSCLFCGKESKTKQDLVKHMVLHTGIKPHKCDKCPAVFAFKGGLTKHLVTHTDARKFQCSQCDSKFTRKEHLKFHEAALHSNERPYKCNICSSSFKRTSCLKLHLIKHTGKKSYSCSHCDLKMASRSDLNKHLRVHTGDKPYNCDQCGRTFSWTTSYKTHLKTHEAKRERFECESCGKLFISEHSQRVHQFRYHLK